jgi:drug/metabolite transporter (DMT)-like permease
MLISCVGVVWTVLLLLDLSIRGEALLFNSSTWGYGISAGISVAIANILLLESLRHMEVSLGSTIYRLNTIAVVLLSILLLGESITLIKLAGIGCGVIAVLFLYRQQHSDGLHATLKTGLIIVVVGALLRAVYGVLTKAGLLSGANADSLMLISAVCWIVSGLIYAIGIEKQYSITREKLAYSIVSGLLVYGIVRTLVMALTFGEASIVITIANMSFLMALLVAVMLKMETLNWRKIVAMFFAVSAIALLSLA